MNSILDGIETVGGALATLAPALEENGRRRFPVHRTERTAQRESIPSQDRQYVYERDGFACVRCNSRNRLTLDHIIPWSANGSDHVDNLRTLCWNCNEERSNFRGLDDTWTPLPLTHCCIDCDLTLAEKYPDYPPIPTSHPGIGPCFCWFHREPALGIPSKWFKENNVFWDFELNWHRPVYPGFTPKAFDEATMRLKYPWSYYEKPGPSEAVQIALRVIEATEEWADSIREMRRSHQEAS